MYRCFFKPLMDFILALIALPFVLLITIPVAIAIKCEDGGPVFYCGKRLGRYGKIYRMAKFRSMRVNAPDLRLADGLTYNGEDDPRVTKIGKFLRKTSLDELPQIVNILAFQMSFIGPRPDLPDVADQYEGHALLKLRPGLSGYNQAYFRNSIDGAQKIVNDDYYAEHLSFIFDVKIFFKTIRTVLKSENVFIEDAVSVQNTFLAGKKLLIVGAGILQMPAIRTAKEMGLKVAVADFDPQAPGVALADRYFNVSTVDKEGLLRAAREYRPDGIMTMATDMPMRAIAYVCAELQLPCIDEDCALKCTDKIQMIRAFHAHGVAAPIFYEIEKESDLSAIADTLNYPCILKPAESSGSRGIYLARDKEELWKAYDYTINTVRTGGGTSF